MESLHNKKRKDKVESTADEAELRRSKEIQKSVEEGEVITNIMEEDVEVGI